MVSEKEMLLARASRHERIAQQLELKAKDHRQRAQSLRDEADSDLATGALPTTEGNTQSPERPPTRYNLDFSQKIDAYVASYPYNQVIKVGEMLKVLREQGIGGHDKSVRAYCY